MATDVERLGPGMMVRGRGIYAWLLPLAGAIHLVLGGCTDLLIIDRDASWAYRFPPSIDNEHLSPPSRQINAISIGKNCQGRVFWVPPIRDRNIEDRLHYLWFLDNRLIQGQVTIEPKGRSQAVITLKIDERSLLTHFENRLPEDFYDSLHFIDFYVSDVKYTIPESRYIDGKNRIARDHSDHVYWIVSFSDDPC